MANGLCKLHLEAQTGHHPTGEHFTDIFLNWKEISQINYTFFVYSSLLTMGQNSHHVHPLTTGQLLFRGKIFFIFFRCKISSRMLRLGATLKTGFCFAGGAQVSSAVKTVKKLFKLWRKELLTFFIFFWLP